MSKAKSKSGLPEECNIQVALRCRPRNEEEKTTSSPMVVGCDSSKAQIEIKIKQGVRVDSKTYTFDRVFGPDSTQVEVYQGVVEPILDEVLMGYNCTVFAYGQTGTGKTHTMEGYRSEQQFASYIDDPGAGIIPRALHQLFEKLEASQNEFSVRVSFLEIYNEELFDLLSSSDEKKLKLFDDGRAKGSVLIQGLEEVAVQSKDEVYEIMAKGAERRRTGETKMNKCSSRSHSIFVVTIHQKENNINGEEVVKTGKLYMVDLAGSENIGRSGAVKDRAREAGSINQSLLTLGRVINKLVEHAQHIPYRESKLTRILQDSLGGRTKTSIIATVSPAAINLEETLSTLDYALRAKSILNRPEVNQRLTKKALIKEFNEEIERLKKDLQACREKNGIYVSQENYDHMQARAEAQQAQIDELMERIELTKDEMAKAQTLFEEAARDLARATTELTETREELRSTGVKLEEKTATLAVTERDRDAQKYLVRHHSEVEDVLFSQAEMVRSAADLSTGHVSALHSRIQRGGAVEDANLAATMAFEKDVTRRVTLMHESVSGFVSAQQATFQEMTSSMESFVAASSAQLKGVRDMMAAGQDAARAHAHEAAARMAAAGSAVAGFAQAETKELDKDAQALVEGNEALLRAHVAGPFAALAAILEQQQAAVAKLSSTVATWTEGLAAETANFAEEQARMVAALGNMAVAQHHVQAEERAQHAASLRALEQQQQQQLAAAATDMQQRVADMLGAMVRTQGAALGEAVAAMTAKSSRAQEQQEQYLQSFTAAVSTTETQARARAGALGESVVRGRDVAFGQCEGVVAALGAGRAGLDSARHEATTAFAEQSSSVTRRAEGAKARVAAVQGAVLAVSGEAQAELGRVEETVANTTVGVTSGLATVEEGNSGTVNAWMHAVTASGAKAGELGTSMSSALQEAEGAVRDFAQHKFRRYVATGETPQRQVYSFPRAFTRARPHEQLLREFEEAEGAPDASKSTVVVSNEMTVVSCLPAGVVGAGAAAAAATVAPVAGVAGGDAGKENAGGEATETSVRSKLPVFAPARRQLGAVNND